MHLSLEKVAPVPRAIGTVSHILCCPVLGGCITKMSGSRC